MSAPDGVDQAAGEARPVELPTSDCTICRHPDAAAIDEALLGGTPIRTVAETHGLSRSSVHRHRQNHLSVEAITEPDPDGRRPPLKLVDVHAQLTALADRLEEVVKLATRTRKAPTAVAAMRELRQTLEAIARVQADPQFAKAAQAEALQKLVDEGLGHFIAGIVDLLARELGLDPLDPEIAGVVVACLERGRAGLAMGFEGVDTSPIMRLRERHAMAAARRMEAEIERRVEAELRRRENQARPAIEATPEVAAIEGGVSSWV